MPTDLGFTSFIQIILQKNLPNTQHYILPSVEKRQFTKFHTMHYMQDSKEKET